MSKALQQGTTLFQHFKQHVDSKQLEKAEPYLAQLRKIMLDLDSLPPISQETPTASDERRLFAHVLEYAVLLSVEQQDKASFQRNISALRPYYTLFGQVDLDSAPSTATVIGLTLLFLLVENRLADFHCELELLSVKSRNHPFILFCTQLEKHLVVGAYDQVLSAAASPPTHLYSFFLASLMETVRVNVAECISAAYQTITLAAATQLLMFQNVEETRVFVQENYADWTEQGDRWIISGQNKGTKASEIRSLELIAQTLSYATELDRIV